MADSHYKTATLRRCFADWLLFVSLERRDKELKKEQATTKNKMAAFLQAASSGLLSGDVRKSLSMENMKINQEHSQQKLVSWINPILGLASDLGYKMIYT